MPLCIAIKCNIPSRKLYLWYDAENWSTKLHANHTI